MKRASYSYVLLGLCVLSVAVMVFIIARVNSLEFSGESPYQGVSRLIKKSKTRAKRIKLKIKKKPASVETRASRKAESA